MAASDHKLEILRRGGGREATIRRRVDPDDEDELLEILHEWLEDHDWDRDLWEKFSITLLTHSRLIEVHA